MNKQINRKRVFFAFAKLHLVLRELQSDLGIDDLSKPELDVLSVAIQLAKGEATFSSSEIVGHPLSQQYGRATVYRAISSLEDRGFFAPERTGAKHSYTLDLETN